MVILKPDALYSLKVSSNLQRSQNVVLPSFCSFPKNKKGEHFNFLDVRKCFIIRYLEVIGSFRSSCNFWFCIVAPKKGLRPLGVPLLGGFERLFFQPTIIQFHYRLSVLGVAGLCLQPVYSSWRWSGELPVVVSRVDCEKKNYVSKLVNMVLENKQTVLHYEGFLCLPL